MFENSGYESTRRRDSWENQFVKYTPLLVFRSSSHSRDLVSVVLQNLLNVGKDFISKRLGILLRSLLNKHKQNFASCFIHKIDVKKTVWLHSEVICRVLSWKIFYSKLVNQLFSIHEMCLVLWNFPNLIWLNSRACRFLVCQTVCVMFFW